MFRKLLDAGKDQPRIQARGKLGRNDASTKVRMRCLSRHLSSKGD
jgi:hypothetical protein